MKLRYSPGDIINNWKLINYSSIKHQWLAECICGKLKYVWIDHLSRGKSKSFLKLV